MQRVLAVITQSSAVIKLLRADAADIEKALSSMDEYKSSGDELESKEAGSRSGTDSTRDELSGSDMDASTAVEPRYLDGDSETAAEPVPLPRRRKGTSSCRLSQTDKEDQVKPVQRNDTGKQKKMAPSRPNAAVARQRGRGTICRSQPASVMNCQFVCQAFTVLIHVECSFSSYTCI